MSTTTRAGWSKRGFFQKKRRVLGWVGNWERERAMVDKINEVFCRWKRERGEGRWVSAGHGTVLDLDHPGAMNRSRFRWKMVFSGPYYFWCVLVLSVWVFRCTFPRIRLPHRGSHDRRLTSTVPALCSHLFLPHRDVFLSGDMVGAIINNIKRVGPALGAGPMGLFRCPELLQLCRDRDEGEGSRTGGSGAGCYCQHLSSVVKGTCTKPGWHFEPARMMFWKFVGDCRRR